MPSKRIILLHKTDPFSSSYRYVLWADVPAGNQIAYANPVAQSEFDNATAAELQAIRDGLVAEKAGTYISDNDSITTIQTNLQAQWTAFQTAITNEITFGNYGRYWDSSGVSWVTSPGVPMASAAETYEGIPAFIALTPVSAYGANKFHFVLYNAGTALQQTLRVKIRLVAILPGTAAVTGAAPSIWTLRRRNALTTPPAGGTFSAGKLDSAQALSSVITLHNAPTTSPAGGTIDVFHEFIPQADEQKLSTADAPTLSTIYSGWGGMVIYRCSDVQPARPLIVRAGESLEVQQSATAGTGNGRVLCVFTVG